MHVVITGRIEDAIIDWCDKLATLDRARMIGTKKDGGQVMFVSVDWPEKLYGIFISSFEIHPTARDLPKFSRAISLALAAQRHKSDWE